jgi:hypothetical protein
MTRSWSIAPQIIIMFVLLGWGVTSAWDRLDPRDHYRVIGSVMTDKSVYEPCDLARITFIRSASLDLSGNVQTELKKIEASSVIGFEVADYRQVPVLVNRGEQTVKRDLFLPCYLEDGTYFFQRAFVYQYHGWDKIYSYQSERFDVQQGE